MSRLFIIGAGFSKAIANAPLASEVIYSIYKYSLDKDNLYEYKQNLINELKLGRYTKELAAKLTENIEKISEDIDEILKKINGEE